MKKQLSLFDGTHGILCTYERLFAEALAIARKQHRGQQAAKLAHQALVHAKMQYEIKHNMISPSTRARAA
jgi:hypothetical protein